MENGKNDIMIERWADFVFDDVLSPEIRRPIAESWKKCKAAHVNPSGGEGRHIDERVLASAREVNRQLIETAMPVMTSIFEIVRRSGFLIVLTDSAGYLLETLGDEEVTSRSNDLRFRPGALWSNLEVGTNAISVSLDYDMPIQMSGPEHYCASHHEWTCSAAPIHGANGEIVGCIDLSGEAKNASPHTLGLAQAAALGIEGQLVLQQQVTTLGAALESGTDGVILLGEDYRVLWMNGAASRLLETDAAGVNEADLRNMTPDIDWRDELWESNGRYLSDNVRLLVNGTTKYCSSVTCSLAEYGVRALCVTLRQQKHLINAVNRINGNRAVYKLSDFYTCDDGMKKTLALASKFARYEGNILIEGESGTGKEVLAQAIHNTGKNSQGPFVAVNCASIPRDLFEMELFGYDAGAFPGKVSEGKPGRFELAQHGTLFLDEVSALPLEFQPKLLRAVETHKISRLGSGEEIELDIRIVSSTNQSLARMVESGRFRRDLYYRLNVLKLEIPPLRDRRGDIACCAEHFLDRLNGMSFGSRKTMTPEFLEGLMKYDWPGNTRQLQNGIARAYYAGAGDRLTGEHLSFAIEPGESSAREDGGGEGAIRSALALFDGDVEAAAERLGVSRATLYRRMRKLGIDPKSVRGTKPRPGKRPPEGE